MPDDLRPDFDQFHKQAAKRPVLDCTRKNQASQKIAQIIGQNKQPDPHLIRDETLAPGAITGDVLDIVDVWV